MAKKEFDMEKFAELMMDEFQSLRTEMRDEFQSVRTEMRDGFASIRGEMDQRFDGVHVELKEMRYEVRDNRQRLEVVEEQTKSNSGFAKEIDHLFVRSAAIEKHLGIEIKQPKDVDA